jgi:hypothetical protein
VTGRPVRARLAEDRARHLVARGQLVGETLAAEVVRCAPSPRTASEIRKRGAPSTASAVGWNWTNSMSRSAAPARWAMATPSPVATERVRGLAKTWPAPPVASSVPRAEHARLDGRLRR